MSRKVASKDDFQTRLTGVSEWQTATRDDALVAGESNATRSMDRVYALNTASFFDEVTRSSRVSVCLPPSRG